MKEKFYNYSANGLTSKCDIKSEINRINGMLNNLPITQDLDVSALKDYYGRCLRAAYEESASTLIENVSDLKLEKKKNNVYIHKFNEFKNFLRKCESVDALLSNEFFKTWFVEVNSIWTKEFVKSVGVAGVVSYLQSDDFPVRKEISLDIAKKVEVDLQRDQKVLNSYESVVKGFENNSEEKDVQLEVEAVKKELESLGVDFSVVDTDWDSELVRGVRYKELKKYLKVLHGKKKKYK